MTSRFQFLNEKLYFCPHIAESVYIPENAQYRRIFCPKLSAIFGLPLLTVDDKKELIIFLFFFNFKVFILGI
jgi:hypothetical protein